MKVLIDENLPKRLYRDFVKHGAVTVSFMKWSGKENGELLGAMVQENFQALITLDKNLQYQQNFKQYPMVVVIIHAAKTEYPFLKPLVAEIETLLDKNPAYGVYTVEQK